MAVLTITPESTRLIGRFRAIEAERTSGVEQEWVTIATYVAPGMGKFFKDNSGESSIEWSSSRQIYDSTANVSYKRLASSIHGSLTNPAFQWFEQQWRDPALRKNQEATEWLERAGKRVFDELQDSNFNLAVTSAYKQLTSYGTAPVTQEPKADPTQPWNGVTFTNVPLKQAYFEPDEQGGCHIFYRKMEWRASRYVDKFDYENLPDKIQTSYDSASDQLHSVVFIVYPNPNKKDVSLQPATLPKNRPYLWTYLDYDDGSIFKEGGYFEMPAYVPRWEVMDESMWGRGPCWDIMGDILTLNELVKMDLRSREKVVDPALLIGERGMVNQLDLGPGAQNAVRNPDAYKVFESGARFDAVESAIGRLRGDIRTALFIDQLELKDSPAMTATEVQVRYEMMQKLLSETMSRIREELLNPLLTRTFNLLYRAGELGQLPQGVENADYDIEYVGPLSRAQRFDQSASIERWITQLQLIAQAGEPAMKVLLVPDYDVIARDAAKQLNLPTAYTRPKADVDADMEAMKQQQQRQASADAATAESAAAKNLGQAQQLTQGDQNIAPVAA